MYGKQVFRGKEDICRFTQESEDAGGEAIMSIFPSSCVPQPYEVRPPECALRRYYSIAQVVARDF